MIKDLLIKLLPAQSNNLFECIQFIVNTVFGLLAILLAWLGLRLWRKQLKGGDLYNYSKEALFELRKLLNLIEEYRYIFNTEELEETIWLKIHEQFSLYEAKMILVTVLSKQKINDKINGKNVRDYLTIIYKNKMHKNSIIEREEKNTILEIERKEISNKLSEIDKILKIRNEQDEFGDELNQYFDLMCQRLKKYIK